MVEVTMTVNGKSVTRSVKGNTLMTEFLRDELRLTGTHVGCDTSQCGACTIHVDGKQVKACTMFAAEAQGADIATIDLPHPRTPELEDTDGFFHVTTALRRSLAAGMQR